MRASQLIDRYNRGLGTVLVARDVTEANNQVRRLAAAHAQLVRQVETIDRLRADLAELASRDALTGLHNRRHLVKAVAAMIAAAERTGETFAVVLVDVDRFKAVNDVHGHQAGDAVLVGLARLMRERAPAEPWSPAGAGRSSSWPFPVPTPRQGSPSRRTYAAGASSTRSSSRASGSPARSVPAWRRTRRRAGRWTTSSTPWTSRSTRPRTPAGTSCEFTSPRGQRMQDADAAPRPGRCPRHRRHRSLRRSTQRSMRLGARAGSPDPREPRGPAAR